MAFSRGAKPLHKIDVPSRWLIGQPTYLANQILRYAQFMVGYQRRGLAVVVLILIMAGGLRLLCRSLIICLMETRILHLVGSVPAGYSMDETLRIAERMEKAARPLWEGKAEPDGPPEIERFFFVAYSGGAFAGAAAKDPSRVSELQMVLARPFLLNRAHGRLSNRRLFLGDQLVGHDLSVLILSGQIAMIFCRLLCS